MEITDVVVSATGVQKDVYWSAKKGDIEVTGMETVNITCFDWWLRVRINNMARWYVKIEQALTTKSDLIGKRWTTWW